MVVCSAARDGVALDLVPFPPARETMSSPDGRWMLEISVEPRARDGHAIGTMRHDGAMLWQHRLNQPIRPRFAVVADDGAVALFGCWHNIPDDVSIEVLDPGGATRLRLDQAAIERAVGVSVGAMADAVRHGVWLDRVPRIQGGQVLLGAAGRALVLDLRDGVLRTAR